MAIIEAVLKSEDTSIVANGFKVKREYAIKDSAVKDNCYTLYQNWKAYGLPDLGDNYPLTTNWAKVSSIKFNRGENSGKPDGYRWTASLEYEPPNSTKKPSYSLATNVSTTTETSDETDGRYDLDNKANVNSAGDFFEDKLPIKNKIAVFTYKKSFTTNPTQTAYTKVWCTNSDVWNGFAIGTCLIRNFTTEKAVTSGGGVVYWNCSIEIAYNPLTWTLKKADCGYYSNAGRILEDRGDGYGAPKESPTLLDGSGNVSTSTTPTLLSFRIYGTTTFSDLGLPSPIA